jgi:hypothetical protein
MVLEVCLPALVANHLVQFFTVDIARVYSLSRHQLHGSRLPSKDHQLACTRLDVLSNLKQFIPLLVAIVLDNLVQRPHNVCILNLDLQLLVVVMCGVVLSNQEAEQTVGRSLVLCSEDLTGVVFVERLDSILESWSITVALSRSQCQRTEMRATNSSVNSRESFSHHFEPVLTLVGKQLDILSCVDCGSNLLIAIIVCCCGVPEWRDEDHVFAWFELDSFDLH